MEFASDVVSIEKNGGVGTLWLDRPEKYNAMNESFWLAIPEALKALESDKEINAIIVAGRGKHFCVGLDLVDSGIVSHQSVAGYQPAATLFQPL